MGFSDIRFILLFVLVFYCFTLSKMATMNIQLNKQNVGEPWGFRLQGGQDFRQQLMIKKVSDLQTGDGGGWGAGICSTPEYEMSYERFNWVYFRIFCLIFFLN